jgi:hypothetical protein
MDIKLLNRKNLRPLLKLIDQRDNLQDALDKIHAQIDAVFHGSLASIVAPAKAKRGRKPGSKGPRKAKVAVKASTAKAKAPARRAPRGSLKKKILAELKAAGDKGISAKELSTKLKVPNQNIHVWFNSTGTKMKEIQKVGRGHWVLKSNPA